MTLRQKSISLLAVGLVGYPIGILAYWVLEPAYGLLDSAAIVNSFTGHQTVATIANAFAMIGCLLAIPATLAAMLVIGDLSPRLAVVGGAMSILGWVAVFGTLVLDPVAVQIVAHGAPTSEFVDLFKRLSTSPTIIALNATAAFHLIGGIVLGVAFWRTKLVPRWAAMILIIGGPIHFASNIAGILVVDSATWIALLPANVMILRQLTRASS